jgi:hypothetical protein
MSNLTSIPTRTLSFYVSECERVHDLLDRLDVPRVEGQSMSQRMEYYVAAYESFCRALKACQK